MVHGRAVSIDRSASGELLAILLAPIGSLSTTGRVIRIIGHTGVPKGKILLASIATLRLAEEIAILGHGSPRFARCPK